MSISDVPEARGDSFLLMKSIIWLRPIAFTLDGLILGLAVIPLVVGLHFSSLSRVLSIFLSAFYYVPSVALLGTTLSGRLLHLRITTADGKAPGFWRSIVRWAVLVGTVSLVSAIASWASELALVFLYCPAFFDSQKRAFTDYLAGTCVTHVRTA